MKSRLLALLLLATGGAGCVDDRASVEIFSICSMTDDCTFAATCTTNYMGPVMFNSSDFLMLALEVHNQVQANADAGAGRVNSNDAHVTGGSVTFEGTGAPGGWSFFAGNTVVPANGTSLVWSYVAPPGSPNGQYTAQVTLSGYFDNGREFDTGPFPIGLLVNSAWTGFCPVGTVDACPGTGAQSVAACVTP